MNENLLKIFTLYFRPRENILVNKCEATNDNYCYFRFHEDVVNKCETINDNYPVISGSMKMT